LIFLTIQRDLREDMFCIQDSLLYNIYIYIKFEILDFINNILKIRMNPSDYDKELIIISDAIEVGLKHKIKYKMMTIKTNDVKLD
jgi:hypothetical protein